MVDKQKYTLITRPEAEAKKLKMKLQAIGIDSLVESILKIKIIKPAKKLLKKSLAGSYQAIVITSINGAKAFIELSKGLELKKPKFIVIGKATAATLKAAKFENVIVAGEDIDDLKKYILQKLKASNRPIIYLSGNVVTADLEAELSPKGYKVSRIVIYLSLPSSNLSKKTIQAIKERKLKYALFYSSRTASIFNRLINESHLNKYLDKVSVFCFSRKVAEVAKDLSWKSINIPRQPSEEDLIQLVNKFDKSEKK